MLNTTVSIDGDTGGAVRQTRMATNGRGRLKGGLE